jgi:signal transduction histidine kinase/PAS domain-containing protein
MATCLNYPMDELVIGALWWDHLPGEEIHQRQLCFEEAMNSPQPFHFEEEVGGVWYGYTLHRLLNPDTEPVGVAVSVRDVSERRRFEAALARSEARLADAERLAGLGSWEWDSASGRTWWSPELYRMLGCEPLTVPATSNGLLDRIHPGDRELVMDAIASALRGQGTCELEHRLLRFDGAVRYVHTRVRVRRFQDGLMEIVGTSRDVTEERSSVANAGLGASVDVLLDIQSAILQVERLEDVARIALEHLISSVNCSAASLLYCEERTDAWRVAWRWKDEELEVRDETFSLLDFFDPQAYRRGKARLVEDLSSSLRLSTTERWLVDLGVRSYTVVPLIAHGELDGLVALGSRDPGFFDTSHVRLLEEIAPTLAIAVEQRRLQERVHLQNAKLEQRVTARTRELRTLYRVTAVANESLDFEETLARSLEATLDGLTCRAATVHLLERVDGHLYLAAQAGDLAGSPLDRRWVGNDLAQQVLKSTSPVVVGDLSPSNPESGVDEAMSYLSYIGVPMRAHGRIIGVLGLITWSDRSLSVEQVKLLDVLADHIGVAVENVWLRRQAERTAAMEERERLARDLHDSVAQSLYSLRLFAEAARECAGGGDLPGMDVYLDQMGLAAQEALRDIRLALFELRPSILESEGLVSALRRRVDMVENRLGLQVALDCDPWLRLDPEVEAHLYAIAQEALNNSLKHAGTTEIRVCVDVEDNCLTLKIRDNGVGFDCDAGMEGGMGLETMRERAETLGAELSISSQPGDGTTVTLKLHSDR